MKRSEVKDFIPLLQAWADGKTLQWRPRREGETWRDAADYDDLDTSRYEYRIKPWPREWYEVEDNGHPVIPSRFYNLEDAKSFIDQVKEEYKHEYKIIKVREVTE